MSDHPKAQPLALALALWDSVLIGDPPPVIRGRYLRMKNPRPGDTVVEVSTSAVLLRDGADAHADQWDGQFVTYDRTETDELGGDALVCINPDGTEFRWTNATLIAVPRPGDASWRHEALVDLADA